MENLEMQNGAANNVPVKDRIFVVLAAGMILPAAFLLSATLNLPHVFVICTVGLFISMLVGRAVKFTDRSVIYSIVAALVAAVILDLAFPVDKNRFILLGDIFSTNISAPFLLYLAVLITFFEYNVYSTGVAASFSIFAIMLSSDITLNTQQSEGLLLFTTHTRNFNKIFSALIVTEIVFVLLALQPRRMFITSIRGRWEKRIVLVFAIVFTALIGIGGFILFRTYEEDFRRLENIFLRAGMRRYAQSRFVVFNKEVNLNRLLTPEMAKDRNEIVLRAESKFPPGYLRGRVYSRYRDGKWTSPEQSFEKMSFLQYEGVIAIKSFFYKGGEKETPNAVTIYPSSRFSSDVLLAPGSGIRFDMVADRLNFSQDGVLIPEEWQKDGGYTVFLPKPERESAYPLPAVSQERGNIPLDVAPAVSEILPSIISDSQLSDREAVNRVVGYFMNNYSYSLEGKEPPPGMDPVVNFMRNTRSGHCELFATAAVMLLRQHGIPARYVTGFVCEEAHPSGRYYVARLWNAHAWAEAFLRDEGRWILVEATLPSGIPDSQNSQMGFLESWFDRMKEMAQSVLSDLRRGNFAKAIVDFFSLIAGAVKDFVWDPVRGPGSLLLAICVAVFYMRRRRRMLIERAEVELDKLGIREEYLRIEKMLKRRYGIQRRKGMTIIEWTGLLPASDPDVARFVELSRKYMDKRFRQGKLNEREAGEFIIFARDFRKRMKKA